MRITSSDNRRSVDVGTTDILMSVYSTIQVRLSAFVSEFPLPIHFLESGICNAEYAIETARQFNLIRDHLSQIGPHCAVYDYRNESVPAPWSDKLSSVITSCANLYTTADGGDLLFEIVSILTYAGIVGVQIRIE